MIGVKSQKHKQSLGIRNNASNSILIGQRILFPNTNNQNNSNAKTDIYENKYSTNSQFTPLGLNQKKSNIIKSSNLEKK